MLIKIVNRIQYSHCTTCKSIVRMSVSNDRCPDGEELDKGINTVTQTYHAVTSLWCLSVWFQNMIYDRKFNNKIILGLLILSVCSFAQVRSNSLWNLKKKHALDCTGPCVKFSLLKSKINEEKNCQLLVNTDSTFLLWQQKKMQTKKNLKSKNVLCINLLPPTDSLILLYTVLMAFLVYLAFKLLSHIELTKIINGLYL